jgi:hypothetical protein
MIAPCLGRLPQCWKPEMILISYDHLVVEGKELVNEWLTCYQIGQSASKQANSMPPHDPHFHDCPNVIADKPCGGKASILDGQGRAAFKCTRCRKVTSEAELRRLLMRRVPADDD